MGMFDTIRVKCKNCNKFTESQTKVLGSNLLDNIKIGDPVTNEFGDCIFELKDPCEHCKREIRIRIEKGILKELVNLPPDIIERNFGGVYERRKNVV